MKAIVLGSTGLVGGQLVKLLLDSNKFDKVRVLNRRPLGLSHPKLKEEIIDFKNIDPIDVTADFLFCCLGTTIKKAGSKAVFRKVDLDLPMSFARKFSTTEHQAFVVISAIGTKEDSMFFYNRVKGELEKELKGLPLNKLIIVRPSLLLGDRSERRPGEDIGKFFAPLLKRILPAKHSPINAREVATAMLDLALTSKTQIGIENEIIK